MLQLQAFRDLILIVVFSFVTLSGGALAAARESGLIAVDMVSAGRLRMQSQRLAKLYLLA